MATKYRNPRAKGGRATYFSSFIQILKSNNFNYTERARVGTDHLYWKSGRVGLSENLDFESRVGSVIWSVGGSVIFEVKFHEKNLENDSYH